MLRIEHLQAGYGGHAVVSVPDLTLARGEHCLILGASGSGKTTLLYAIAGLLRPISGTVSLHQTNMTALRPQARDAFRGKHFGIIYQTLHMVAALSVCENLLLACYAAGVSQDMKKMDWLLLQLGLYDKRDAKPEELSHGQQQRVAIARAAITQPQVILGDEPTSALDDTACETVMQLLLDAANNANASLIVATHDARIKKYFMRTITLEEAA